MVPAAGVIGEAMVLLTLARFVLEKTGGDSLAEVRDNLARYRERTRRSADAAAASERAPARPAPGATTRADGPRARRPPRERQDGRRAPARPRHGAAFIDLDEVIGRRPGRPIPAIFEEEGEAGFRARERAAVAALGPADAAPRLRRVISTGGGAADRPAQPLAPLPRPARAWLRRAAGGPGQRPATARTRGHCSPAATRSGRCASWPRRAPASTAAGTGRGRRSGRGRGRAPATRSPAVRRKARACWPPRPPSAATSSATGTRSPGASAALAALGARRATLAASPGVAAPGSAWPRPGRRERDRDPAAPPAGGRARQALGVVEAAARELAAPPRSGAIRSSPSAAARSATRPASWRRPGCAACRSSTCRRRSSPRSTPRSAARPPSTCRRARTWSAPSTSRRRSSSTSPSWGRCRRASCGPRSARRPRWRPSATSGSSSCWRPRARRWRRERPPRRIGALAEVVERCGWAKVEVVTADEREQGGGSTSTSATRWPTRSRRPPATGDPPRRGGRLRAARGPRGRTAAGRHPRARSSARRRSRALGLAPAPYPIAPTRSSPRS